MVDFIAHFFLPRSSNNYRAKLAHNHFLLAIIAMFILGGFILSLGRSNYPSVLGIASEITAQQLLLDTNKERIAKGLEPLVMNDKLSQAALDKAKDMFTNDYWAHNSPEGKTPWTFIKKAGYSYIFAGENLARGFNNSDDIVSAWMASPDHKKNLLSSNYKNIGFAVEKGILGGEETILVVQMFGNPAENIAEVGPSNSYETGGIPKNIEKASVAGAGATPIIDTKSFSRNFSYLIVLCFIFIFALDIILIKRKRVLRFASHNIDHILYLTTICIIIFLLAKGSII